jgi:hypothetical protein
VIAQRMRHPAKVDAHRGVWGGSGVRYTSPFALAVGQTAPRHPLSQRSSSTSPAGPPSRRAPSGLNEPQFPVFSRRNGKRDLAHPENREIAGVLERGAGLLLTPTFDHLFDKGYISFSDEGRIVVSDRVPETVRGSVGLPATQVANAAAFTDAQKGYLAFHRSKVFLP